MLKFVTLGLVAGQQVLAQTDEDLSDYSLFAFQMEEWGYTWEPIKVTTEDSYVLTTFHITGRVDQEKQTPRDESLNPVVLMSGLQCDATTWLVQYGTRVTRPLPLKLFDEGFDVYMAANRGTKYCQEHLTLTIEDDAYWEHSWAEMGLYDAVGNIKMINERTDKKVSYIGVSQGTVQMFYALAKLEESVLGDMMFTFAALDPCTIDQNEGAHLYEDGLFHF